MNELEQGEELSSIEKLARREARTNDDGTVRVEVFDWHEENGRVTVEFLTPTNEKKSETMPFPKAGGDLTDYKFYRILQTCDLSVRNADLLEGEMVNANADNWTLSCEREPSSIEHARSLVRGVPIGEVVIATLWVATMLVILISLVALL